MLLCGKLTIRKLKASLLSYKSVQNLYPAIETFKEHVVGPSVAFLNSNSGGYILSIEFLKLELFSVLSKSSIYIPKSPTKPSSSLVTGHVHVPSILLVIIPCLI